MTNIIGNDALQGQQSRIMEALRKTAQPMPAQPDMRQFLHAASLGLSGRENYFNALDKVMGNQAAAIQGQNNRELGAESAIYDLMQQQIKNGDIEAQAIDNAINGVAGGNPQIYTQLLEDLHGDPEQVNARNAQAKIMQYAARRGITPASVQMDQLKIKQLSEAGDANLDLPAAVREYQYFQSLPPEKRPDYLNLKRTSPEQRFAGTMATEIGKDVAMAKTSLPKVEKEGQYILRLLSDLKRHPGLQGVVGVPNLSGGLLFGKTIPGTPEAGFQARLKQMQGKQFLQAIETLRGTGAISEAEGITAGNSVARMQVAQDEQEFRSSLQEFEEIVQRGIDLMRQKASTRYSEENNTNLENGINYKARYGFN